MAAASVLAAAAWHAAVATAATPGCYVTCIDPGASPHCVVEAADPGGARARELPSVRGAAPLPLAACADAVLRKGRTLSGLFVVDGRPEQFAVRTLDKRFGDLLPRLGRADCVGLLCLEAADAARVAAVGGKGVDDVKSRRLGQPCTIGLPCGSLLRPGGPLVIALTDGALRTGRLRVRGVRADTSTWDVAVAAGRTTLDGTSLKAGAVYAYSLLDDSGAEVAAGEFTVLSARMQADVEAELAQARGSDAGQAALDRIEILIDSELLWDAARVLP